MKTATQTQPAALASVIERMAINRERVHFTQKDEGTYVYGTTPGALDRIAFVANDGAVEWVA